MRQHRGGWAAVVSTPSCYVKRDLSKSQPGVACKLVLAGLAWLETAQGLVTLRIANSEHPPTPTLPTAAPVRQH